MTTETEITLEKINQFAATVSEATSARDEAIMDARKNGATLRRIAAAARMTPQGIAKIVNKNTSTEN